MDSDARIEELFSLAESIKGEVAGLKEAIGKCGQDDNKRGGLDLASIKSLLDDGLTRASEVLRPVAEKVSDKIGKPAGDAVNAVEERIAAHPLASVGIALVAGFAIGKAAGLFASGRYYRG
ncbi:MAG: hypothetical protein LBL73_01695 [Synergistaceae bacterium]|jgi:ElaB/YqjD/DUF883 family membrane-anchored ribosome-binding protein|nr:hypothetical protein [Synergistaceae bacterium]